MMSSSSSPREILQLSLGPKANAITAHLLNLQGLAATNGDEEQGGESYCDPITTHYVLNSTWVPRVLMIDEASANVPAEESMETSTTSPLSLLQSTSSSFVPWQGDIQVLGDASTTSNSPFFQTASAVAYSPYSRYHAPSNSHHSQQARYQTSSDNPRHVVWEDDDDDETDQDEDAFRRQQEAQDYAQKQKAKGRSEWKTTTSVALGQTLQEQYIAEQRHTLTQKPLSWSDIWMPPYSLDSKVVLPFSSQSQLVPHWDVSYCSKDLPLDWKEDILLERLRKLIEPCDYGIQGAMLTTQGCGIYASLTAMLLDELHQECRSASRWVNHVCTSFDGNKKNSIGGLDSADENPQELSWQERQVARVRQNISEGLALYDFTQKANVVLPLRMDWKSMGEFEATSHVAMALEACGLPFRLRGQHDAVRCAAPYQMGLQNAPFLAQWGTDTAWGSMASRISMTEYVTMLQPSSQYSMLELDAVLPKDGPNTIDNPSLYEIIRTGTTVERDQRMRERGEDGYRNRPLDVLPGAWLGDANGGNDKRGLLTSLSHPTHPNPKINLDRSAHHHFSLSASMRPVLSGLSDDCMDGITMRNYLTCLVQGMGIRYRPERSMATVVNETIGNLTFAHQENGSVYGAGVYWKHILPAVDTPVVAVLGNTTRSFWSLNTIATDMKTTVRGSRFHGYVSRDVLNGVLPELDDCDEALEGIFNKRDLYHPPEGAGSDNDDDFD